MKTSLVFALRCCAVAACPALAATPACAQQVIWTGRSGGFNVTWSERDISATRLADGVRVFSERRIAHRWWRALRTGLSHTADVLDCTYRARLLSVAGPVLSVEEEELCRTSGAPIAWHRFASYDLERSTLAQPFAIAAPEVVAEQELVAALQKKPLLRDALGSASGLTSLSALIARLANRRLRAAGATCAYELRDLFPAEFALETVKEGRVALRFSLPAADPACPERMIELSVVAAPTVRFAPIVSAAASRSTGFLMKDLPPAAGDSMRVLIRHGSGRLATRG